MASALFGNESDMARHTLVRSQYDNFRMKYLTFRSLPRAATHEELLSLAKGNLLSINTAQTSNLPLDGRKFDLIEVLYSTLAKSAIGCSGDIIEFEMTVDLQHSFAGFDFGRIKEELRSHTGRVYWFATP